MKLDYYVYHIGIKGMSIEEGYIGITNNPNTRWQQHKRSDTHVGRAIRKYGDDVSMAIIKQTTEQRALEIEEELRPRERMGWNLAIGGGMPPSQKGKPSHRRGKKMPASSVQKMSESSMGELNPRYNTGKPVIATIGGCILEFTSANRAAEFFGVQQSDIRNVCLGKRTHTDGIWFRFK